MIYPRKKKLGDLDVEEAAQIFGISEPPTPTTIYPRLDEPPPLTLDTIPPPFIPRPQGDGGGIVDSLNTDIYPRLQPDTNIDFGARPVPETEAQGIVQPEAQTTNIYPRTTLQNLQDEANSIYQKDYSKAQYDEAGMMTKPAGANRDKKWSLADKIISGITGWWEGGLSGGVKAATNRNYMEQRSDRERLGEIYPRIAQAQQEEAFNSQMTTQAAQRENIVADNELNVQKRLDKREKDLFEANQKVKRDFTNRVWGKQKYWKAKEANAIDRAELARLGLKPEDITDFDFRDPKTKQIGGVTYQWNARTQSFDESNLPKDDSKEIVSYDITDADGVKRTFRTTAEKAAGLVTSTKNAQMQIEAAAQRQQVDIQYKTNRDKQLGEYRNATLSLRTKEYDLRKQAQAATDENQKKKLEQDADKIKIQRQNLLTKLTAAFNSGKLSREEYENAKENLVDEEDLGLTVDAEADVQ